jgi:diguanylate cyclase (GGDEF)-like protein
MRQLQKLFPTTKNVRPIALILALGVFVIFIAFGEILLRYQDNVLRSKLHLETVSYASILRARTERELNSLLYLNSGLGSYLEVRHNSIQPRELNEILAVMYRGSHHIRNFAIAVGYRLTYVFPVKGNEKAIGLNYPDHPDQWKAIKHIIDTDQPVLAGPINLVQGGRGLAYRVPLYISGKYWGLLSMVVDMDSLFHTISEVSDIEHFEFAVRGKDATGAGGEAVWGDMALFADKDVVTQTIEVPGGSWVIGVNPRNDTFKSRFDTPVRVVSVLLGILFAWMLYQLVRNRADMAHLAMYDQLTGLPNRNLFEDRVRMVFARQKRNPEQVCALLFFDLDGFKEINDQFGHKAGDAVLRETADRASRAMRENDTVARWGGDEFIILLENATQEAVYTYITRLREKIGVPVEFEGATFNVGVSIGYALHTDTESDLDAMLKMADKRMYDDKSLKKAGN